MHYYHFNIADYRAKTQHLTPLEHYIYRELIDWYYLDESPIPKKTQLVLRRLRLVSENNQTLLGVLQEFFEETEKGWIHTRINREIDLYKKKLMVAKVNGSKGGRPKKPKKTNSVFLANPEKTNSKPNHKPITNNQEPITNNITAAKAAESKLSPELSTHSSSVNSNQQKEKLTKANNQHPCPYRQIIELYHKICPMLPRVVALSDNRRRALKARWGNGMSTLEDWQLYFSDVAKSKFLTGQIDPLPGRKQFRADIDFLIRESTIISTQEGKYHG